MSLDERTVVARIDGLTLRELRVWVREGWVRPASSERGPVFAEIDVARLRLLCDLREDMAVPNDVLPTIMMFIDQLHGTRRDLRLLTEAVGGQPPEVRRAATASIRARRGDGR